ncbi:MAG: ABC transporter ATP-binding protein [Bryobacteraceae bacterium]
MTTCNAVATGAAVQLSGVGVRYRLMTERDRTLKGRVLSALSSGRTVSTEFWALRGVDLEFEKGQVVGILGTNGSGKSTLLRVISGIIQPAEGTVQTHGRISPILELAGTLHPDLNGRENAILYGSLHKISKDRMQEALPRVIEFSELGAFFEVPLKAYSSGMIARLAFALATQFKPEILLVDEALSVGDEHFQKKSYFRMRKLIEDGNLVIITSHNSALLEQICNRMILISKGAVVGDGAPSKVVAQYRREFI